MIHKPALGFSDLNKPDGVMFAGMLTDSAAYAYVFLHPDLIAILLDRARGTSRDAFVAPLAGGKRLGNEADIYEIVTIDIRRIIFQVLHGDAAAGTAETELYELVMLFLRDSHDLFLCLGVGRDGNEAMLLRLSDVFLGFLGGYYPAMVSFE